MASICKQLKLDPAVRTLAMTRTVTVVAGEEIERKLKLTQANDVRKNRDLRYVFHQHPAFRCWVQNTSRIQNKNVPFHL